MPHESPTSRCRDVDPLDLVALALIEGFGPVTVREHLERIRNEGRPLDDGLPESLRSLRAAARRKFEAANRIGAACVVEGDPAFPAALLDLDSRPTHIWALGDLGIFGAARAVSIVGTRELTGYGERVTRSLANAFARHDVVVVSGMARGIDSVAHLCAIEAGGRTAAVLGTGIDVPYPASNRPLYRRIRDHGVVISESPPGARAHRGSFPTRNRLIAALGAATIVVEAGIKSGALITSDLANGLGREVGMVPGPIDSPVSFGANCRLRDGIGHCIATVDDALALLGISEPSKRKIELANETEALIWKGLERPAANFDVLTGRTGLPARLCLETVTALELRGLIECSITGEVRRR